MFSVVLDLIYLASYIYLSFGNDLYAFFQFEDAP
jgi:hypothetical protein